MAFLNHKDEILHYIEHEETIHKIKIEEVNNINYIFSKIIKLCFMSIGQVRWYVTNVRMLLQR